MCRVGCLLGGVIAFTWIPGSLWEKLLPSFRTLIFLPLFGSAFAAGWVVGFLRLRAGWNNEEGATRSQASITGLLTALVACLSAHAASGSRLPLEAAAMLTGFGLLPSALLATVGAAFAHRMTFEGGSAGRRQAFALVASAALPAAAVLVWPAVYVLGKFAEKPAVVVTPTPPPVNVPPPPKPRYVKPEGFDVANAWKRGVSHEDSIPNADASSPFVLSRDERRLAFVSREGGGHQLVVRHLYDPGPDYSMPLGDGISSMAWSPDDTRIIFLSAESGAFWVCVPESGKMIPLPIPVLEGGQRHGLAWWRDEHVVIYPSRGDPGILSLDSLRITAAANVPEWSKLKEDERIRIDHNAFPPSTWKTATAGFAFIGSTADSSRALALSDEESLYARVAASADRAFTRAFPNRDGTMFFIMEPERLRILYMGLRQSSPLRFIAESAYDFPAAPAVKAALEARSVRAAVAAPIVNPLNGKTVAGDPKRIKGYARFIAATDKTCSVWIEQERQAVREGDVLINLSVIQGGDEYSASPDWWAVIKATDDNQSIPRRADMATVTLPPSPTRTLRPLPEPVPRPPPAAPERPSAATPPPQAATPPPPAVPITPPAISTTPPAAKASATPMELPKPAPPPPKPAPEQKVSEEDQIRAFLIAHHKKRGDRDLDGLVSTYAPVVRTNGVVMTHERIRAWEAKNFASGTRILEKVVSRINLERRAGNQFAARYEVAFEKQNPKAGDVRSIANVQMEVSLTQSGPKIISEEVRVYRREPIRNR